MPNTNAISPLLQKEIEALGTVLSARFTPPELFMGCKVLDITDKDEYATNNGWIECLVANHNQQRCRWKGQVPGIAVDDFVDVMYFASYRLFVVFGQGGAGAILDTSDTVTTAPPNRLYHSLHHAGTWQEAASASDIADDDYAADLWNVVHDASTPNRPDIAQVTGASGETGLKLTIKQNTTQAGIVQFLQAADTYGLRGKTMSLSLDVLGSGITTLRMAIIEWRSTADTITSDVVGTWGTGNPTLATNWFYCTTPSADITIDGTQTRYTFENVTIGSSANNLAVFVWTPAQESNADFVSLWNVQLEIGATSTAYTPDLFGYALRRQMEFIETSGPYVADGDSATFETFGGAWSADNVDVGIFFAVRKRADPSVTLYRTNVNATNGLWSYYAAGWQEPTSNTANNPQEIGFFVRMTKTAAFTVADAFLITGHWKADARL